MPTATAYLQPDADSIDGGWTSELGTQTLAPSIGELVSDDTNFIMSSEGPLFDVCKVSLSDPGVGTLAGPFGISYRYGQIGSQPLNLTVRLLQGSTEIKRWDHISGLGTTPTTVRQVLSSGELSSISDFTNLFLEFSANNLDAVTSSWITTVIGQGGTVSNARAQLVNSLVVGLKADGIYSKLDELVLIAAENITAGYIGLNGTQCYDTGHDPTYFTVDRGYSSGGGPYLYPNIDLGAGGFKYVQDSASFFAWNNTTGQFQHEMGISGSGAYNLIEYTDGNLYWFINNGGNYLNLVRTATTGLYLLNRTGSTASFLDCNGVQIASDATFPSVPVASFNVVPYVGYEGRQYACMGWGGGLNTTDRVNLYNRLRTYMTAVGVP